MEEGGRESDGRGRNEGEGRGGGRGKEWEGGGRERWKRERRGRDRRGRGRERWMGSSSPMSILGAGHRSCTFVCARCSSVDGRLHGDRPGGSWPSMGGRVLLHGCLIFMGGSWSLVGTRCSWVGPWVLNTCGWVVVVVDRGVGCVVSRLWAVEVVHGGRFHPSVSGRGRPCVRGRIRSWPCGSCSFLWVVVVHGSSLLREGWWWVMMVVLLLSFLIVLVCGCSLC